jgi:lipopolysaccharide transport system ATP-binding protein
MNDIAIRSHNLSKRYKIASAMQRHNTLRDQLAAGLNSMFRRNGKPRSGQDVFWALKDVCFEIKERESVGIIGRNGAGKSTLLKILSRITEPSAGNAIIQGRMGSLLEVGTGFHYELSGRENLYLSGAILGMKKSEIDRKFDEIVAFAEIEKFIDTPVKHYSSGMYVRLAFAVAAHLDPDILLIDEVLSVGDLAFQRKCLEHTKRLQESNSTVLFVSHNMFSIKTLCKRVIYLSEGQVRFDGLPEEGIALYEKENRLTLAPWAHTEMANNPARRGIRISDVELLDAGGRRRHVFDYGERMRIRLSYETEGEIRDPNFSVSLFRSDNIPCCNFNAAMDGFAISSLSGKGVIELLTPPLKLVAALYSTNVIVRNAKHEELYTAQVGESFHVRHPTLDHHFGVFHESAEWSSGNGANELVRMIKKRGTGS